MAIRPPCRRGRTADLLFALLLVAAAACGPPAGDTVVVSGKTVHRGMAVEEVELEVFAATPPEKGPVTRGRSGYHGSFALRLVPGSYRVTARGTLPGPGGTDRTLVATRELTVPPGVRRIDRWLLELLELTPP